MLKIAKIAMTMHALSYQVCNTFRLLVINMYNSIMVFQGCYEPYNLVYFDIVLRKSGLGTRVRFLHYNLHAMDSKR